MARPTGNLIVERSPKGEIFFAVKWWDNELQKQIKRRLGKAHLEQGESSSPRRKTRFDGYIKAVGAAADGVLTEAHAVRLVDITVQEYYSELERKEHGPVPTFAKMAQEWLTYGVNVKQWKATTKRQYYIYVSDNSRIIREFGDVLVTEISTRSVEKFLMKLDADPKLSGRSVNEARKIIANILELARKRGHVDRNVVKDTDRRSQNGHRELNVPSVEQVKAIARETKKYQDQVLFLALAFTGMRAGEAFGLQWSDVDFTKRKIHIQRSYTRGQISSPKSGKSRSVPLPDGLAGELDKLYKSRKHHLGDHDPVFVDKHGRRLNDESVRTKFYAALKLAQEDDSNIQQMRVHDLRHTYASIIINQGADLVTVKNLMGHSSLTVTEIYAHMIPDDRLADQISQIFAGESVTEPEQKCPHCGESLVTA